MNGESFPSGLIDSMENLLTTYPLRYWVIDNSGSMLKADSERFVNRTTTIACSRWSELVSTIKTHADLSGHLEAHSIYHFLNQNSPIQEFHVRSTDDIPTAHSILVESQAGGSTPLTEHVERIREAVNGHRESLLRHGRKAVVIFATDGLPSDMFGSTSRAIRDDFVAALKRLCTLPVWLVIRLCTNEKVVLDFYKELDMQLEQPLDVIDDFCNESREIQKVNKWLNYGLPLQLCREMGHNARVFDLLDEQELSLDEAVELLQLLFAPMKDAPDVHQDFDAYMAYLKDINASQPKIWNPIQKRLTEWVDIRAFRGKFGGTNMMKRMMKMSWKGRKQ